jgi:hypothetical protein
VLITYDGLCGMSFRIDICTFVLDLNCVPRVRAQPLVIRELAKAPGYRLPAEVLARELLFQDRFAVSKALQTLMR